MSITCTGGYRLYLMVKGGEVARAEKSIANYQRHLNAEETTEDEKVLLARLIAGQKAEIAKWKSGTFRLGEW